MKKVIITLLGAFAMIFSVNAQNFQNNGFENWSNNTTPSNWNGLKFMNYELAPGSISRTNDAHGGDYAVKLQPKDVNQTASSFISELAPMLDTMKVPGFITNGNIDILALIQMIPSLSNAGSLDPNALMALGNCLTGGLALPADQTVAGISGYINYTEASAGDMFAIVGLFYAGTDTNRQVVAIAPYLSLSQSVTQGSYQQFNAPIMPIGTENPTEAIFIAVVISSTSTGEPSLLLDDVSIDYTTNSLSNLAKTNDIAIYPNPSTGNFTVNCDNGSALKVCNMLGQEVLAIDNYQSGSSISIDKKGMYFVNVSKGGKQITKKLIVK
ncbi:MAG: T9SS type A sorting domain-containing protein [Bacteroidales bacterium]|jgi:hypothetical protein|nr:T9SS type A sorting domain-containing protein [Bacteroidales bacterium]